MYFVKTKPRKITDKYAMDDCVKHNRSGSMLTVGKLPLDHSAAPKCCSDCGLQVDLNGQHSLGDKFEQ